MPLPDYFKSEHGTAIVWGVTGGASPAPTAALTLDNLANGGGRMGDAVDLGTPWDREYVVLFWIETGTAPTAGTVVELCLASSHDNTNWPGKVTGSDAAYPHLFLRTRYNWCASLRFNCN
jgi:hypothetical protein